MTDLKALARQYAAKKPDWAQSLPGVACRDPETGDEWRRCGRVWVRNIGGTMLWFNADSLAVDADLANHPRFQSLMRAIANGPDLDDAATMGVILLGLPNAQLCRRTSWNADGSLHPYVWAGPVDEHGNGEIGKNAAEAIIRAALAQTEMP